MAKEHYEALPKTAANYVPLSPLSFLRRTATIFGERDSVVYGDIRLTWRQVYARARRLAAALTQRGIGEGDTVTALLPNVPAMVEAHFGVAMAGAVLNTVNVRLEEATVSYILSHADCKLLLVDAQYAATTRAAMRAAGLSIPVVRVDDAAAGHVGGDDDDTEYEDFLAAADENFDWQLPADEWKALALNYTSGTSGKPKGVVYHHRGSYLMSMGTAAAWQLPLHPVYLYTVPLFHCNGWGHAWTMCMMAGTLICCRQISAKAVFDAVADHGVTHFGGAPIVLAMLVNADESERRTFSHPVKVMTAGAPPPSAILRETARLGFDVMQVYGLTETYGHVTHCLWKAEWDAEDENIRAEIKSWQGVALPMTEDIGLLDAAGAELARNGDTEQGEIVIRGNTVMKGYYKDAAATEKAFAGGWFHSGDAAVWRDGGYIQIRDRMKDMIISGGENISSVEVEGVLHRHPAVAYAAVVAKPDEKWGETPCAFVELKANATTTEEELIRFCRQHLAGFKTPKTVVFADLPKTATGKIQKFMLRKQATQL